MDEYPPAWWDNLARFNVGPFDDGQGGEVYITGDALWAHMYFIDSGEIV